MVRHPINGQLMSRTTIRDAAVFVRKRRGETRRLFNRIKAAFAARGRSHRSPDVTYCAGRGASPDLATSFEPRRSLCLQEAVCAAALPMRSMLPPGRSFIAIVQLAERRTPPRSHRSRRFPATNSDGPGVRSCWSATSHRRGNSGVFAPNAVRIFLLNASDSRP
jgi:hypothetical protein